MLDWGKPEEGTREQFNFVYKSIYRQLQMNSGRDNHQLQMENTAGKGGCRRRVDFREKLGKLPEGAVWRGRLGTAAEGKPSPAAVPGLSSSPAAGRPPPAEAAG